MRRLPTNNRGDATRGHRLFGCHTLQRDRDPVYGTDAVQYNDADMLEVGNMIERLIVFVSNGFEGGLLHIK